jgi:hypothetical protein
MELEIDFMQSSSEIPVPARAGRACELIEADETPAVVIIRWPASRL